VRWRAEREREMAAALYWRGVNKEEEEGDQWRAERAEMEAGGGRADRLYTAGEGGGGTGDRTGGTREASPARAKRRPRGRGRRGS
jgi:hypothetical protein